MKHKSPRHGDQRRVLADSYPIEINRCHRTRRNLTSLPFRVLAVNGQFPVWGECSAGDGMATSSSDTLSNNANKNTKNLVKGVEKMFKKFPPGSSN